MSTCTSTDRAGHRERALGLVTAALLVLTGCSAIRFGGPEYDLAGSWEGSVTAQGERVPGTLVIEQDGRSLEVGLVAPDFGLNAQGDGEVSDEGEVRIELAYDLQCPGTARLRGTVSEDGDRMSGTLEANDCTGTTTGTFTFTR